MIKMICKDNDVVQAKEIVLNLINNAENKNESVEDYFDAKNYDKGLMTRIVNYPHAIFVGQWNEDNNVASQIGRIEIDKGETLSQLAQRLKANNAVITDASYERNLFGEAVDPKKFIEDLGFECIEEKYTYKIDGKDCKVITIYSPYFVSPFDEKGNSVKGAWESSVKYAEEMKLREALKDKFADCRFRNFWTGSIDKFQVYIPLEETEFNDELIKSGSEEAFKKNVKTEIEAGKDPKQAVAIAHSIKRKYKDSKADKKFKVEWYMDGDLICEEDVFYSVEEAKQYAETHYAEIEEYITSNNLQGEADIDELTYEIREIL